MKLSMSKYDANVAWHINEALVFIELILMMIFRT